MKTCTDSNRESDFSGRACGDVSGGSLVLYRLDIHRCLVRHPVRSVPIGMPDGIRTRSGAVVASSSRRSAAPHDSRPFPSRLILVGNCLSRRRWRMLAACSARADSLDSIAWGSALSRVDQIHGRPSVSAMADVGPVSARPGNAGWLGAQRLGRSRFRSSGCGECESYWPSGARQLGLRHGCDGVLGRWLDVHVIGVCGLWACRVACCGVCGQSPRRGYPCRSFFGRRRPPHLA